ncbi:MAG: DUF4175 domain-containing protein [Paracoccus sp. (in: a-proteobacteria)]|uniref:DUF4175 domain-containing protein n=1 Tax=Paracoccus sp. TaxID=267 RepID=UPI0039E4AB8A
MDRSEPRSLRRAIGLTRAGMWWEAVAASFWPFAVLLVLVWAALGFGIAEVVSNAVLPVLAGAVLVALGAALVWGLRRLRFPSEGAARGRVDATLPGRPLSALRDHVAIGADDPGAEALWRAHREWMRAEAARARAVLPDAGLRWRDPVALRLAGLVALVMTLVFAPAGRFGQGIAALGASFRPVLEHGPDVAAAPSWEGWAEPPGYTRRPTIYLNALPLAQALELPQGTKLSFRLYGEGVRISQDVGRAAAGGDSRAPEFTAERSGILEVAGRAFPLTVIPDAPPTVAPVVAPERRADGRFVQPFSAQDDNGVTGGRAVIALDMGRIDRRFGLAPPPEPRDPVEIELPLPIGNRKEIRGQIATDLSRHPWANLPVTVSLEVRDGIDQIGRSAPAAMILPGRRFFDPLAAALIELRRDLLWSRANAPRSAEVLRAISWQPEGFMDPALAEGLQGAVGQLEGGPLTDEARGKLAQLLWDAAIALEDGGLADALARMSQAQERLSEAIRNGASPDEVRRLMQELRQATDAYIDMLAQRGQDPAEKFDRSPRQQGQQITGDQIQQMMDEIQRLMNEGRMAEAQELLEQFNRMMQNMRVTQDQDGQGGRQRPSDRLAETLRQQQRLADEAMRQMQDQYGQWQQPQDQPGEGQQQQGQDLADRQRALREDLGRQRGLLPGLGTSQGEEVRRNLDQAGRAMEEAEQALRDGDPSGAMERQAQAIQDMREGMRALGDMQAQAQGQEGQPGQGSQQGGPDGHSGQAQGQRGLARNDQGPHTDPLGRTLDGNGNQLGGGDPLAEGPDPARRARDLQDEIRRRSGERARPQDERDYLGRLLENF